MDPDQSSTRDLQLPLLRTVEKSRIHLRVLMNVNRPLHPARRCNETQAAALLGLAETRFLVPRGNADDVRQDPDLQEARGLLLRPVEFAVLHAAAGTHPLHVAGADR
ncbi:MAG: hypothetical protein V9E93_07075 [Steroidobacteraceae bacterium]